MVKIAIVEDIPVFQRELGDVLLQCFGDGAPPEISCYRDGESFLSASYRGEPFAAIFIDIELPGMSGMDLARTLKDNGYAGLLVFTTSHEDYVFQGYEVEAFRYLLKPVKKRDIQSCVDRMLQGGKKRSLLFSYNKKDYNIPCDDILYISSDDHYVTFHMEGGEVERKYTMRELLPELPGQFVRCHRSFIVNLDHLRRIEGKRILMKDGTRIDVAQSYLEAVRKALSNSV